MNNDDRIIIELPYLKSFNCVQIELFGVNSTTRNHLIVSR